VGSGGSMTVLAMYYYTSERNLWVLTVRQNAAVVIPFTIEIINRAFERSR
jgi:hypothetical protein